MPYFLIQCSEDGDVSIEEYTKESLLNILHDDDYGPFEFMKNIKNDDPQEWGRKSLLIKGDIVCPKPIKVVAEYDIE